ncbi:GMP synthase (glutamine-hydrolyzing) domain-containing protein [Spizellomyces punctatus DAOM BR117]|uniref:GMP synthase [glutamine-hydrolyzing] n=1 Tax=Spizellomyces punctatus (strain DAOM BR117) TaxID=645134 RepID=A0A0L0HCS2_SPIPD|nr:GMP synthase (glutamine-hydrolyzing) domain-containing protein [Spizellomyces punctatus DAOM BR117]KNC99320.1 GMP synthase (glutamine-hydrolyzing) domain-containing protein [Spizellomyces punctatus DAOM BR117]|eukprot:XP_016607360.1 GMP synthase (glutamine-hydrolyzing) domain-containing protein [Spizellomyces punctatus DAOM BR117]
MASTVEVSQQYDTILILDFGSQYTHLIARRIRELGVYCELLACTVKIADLKFKPKGVVLSGSPYSVYDVDSPHVDPALWTLGVPILGICYGLQEIAWTKGGKVEPHDKREYGKADIQIRPGSRLFAGLPNDLTVWMSHGDQLSQAPEGFKPVAYTATSPYTAIEKEEEQIYGIQFHPEVTHTPKGSAILRNFAIGICGANANWTMASFVDKEIERIRNVVGPTAQVIGAVSGGVDSTVAAMIMSKAIGDRFHAILVDNGVMRLNECQTVQQTLQKHLGINLTLADASELFLGRLKGVTDPEKKRKIIGNSFIEVFEAEGAKIEAQVEQEGKGKIEFLLQGTLYPDVIESISFKGPSATIKTHHNVGGLLDDMKLKVIEPLRELFKDEVRALGSIMGIDDELIWRHPFPGPGIAIRILGEVTPEQVAIARHADHIYIEEIKKAGLYRKISQAYAALLPVRSVGVMGDKRTYEQVIALRAVETKDFMTADWFEFPYDILKRISSRIINEVQGVNRVVYDVSSKPPATIEWE